MILSRTKTNKKMNDFIFALKLAKEGTLTLTDLQFFWWFARRP